ncbi:hypothetical protein BD779DRAFT_945372 [Infundibulicybe gibba]|nr:hypothetical protein BD779DRAFT_945372 [Infundibulicybe gibba]
MTGIEPRTADIHLAPPNSGSGFAPGGFLSSFDPMSFKGAAITEEDSFLISPLPEFTGRLPSALDSFAALPEVDEDIEKKMKNASAYETDKPSSVDPSEAKSIIGKEPAISRRPTFINYAAQAEISSEPLASAVTPIASGLTLSMPKAHESPRSRSSSRGRSLRSRASSRSPVQTPSPLKPLSAKPSPDVQASSQLNLPQSRDGEILRSRLHDLLDTAVPSSLPNMSTSFPSSFSRDGPTSRDIQVSRPPSRSSSSSSQGQSSMSIPDRSERQPQGVPIPSKGVAIASSPSPSASISPKYYLAQLQAHVPVSHASSAAKALEEAQKAMKAQQKEAERARRRAEREQREVANDNERSRMQTPPVYAYTPQSNLREHTAAPYISHIYSHANSLSRRGSTATQGRPTPSIRSQREESFSSPHRPTSSSKNTVATGLILNPNVVSDTMLRT